MGKWRGCFSQAHKQLPVRPAGVEVRGGDIVMVVHAVVTRRERMTCKSGGVEGAPSSLSHFPISFSSQTLERSADLSPRGQHSHFDPLLLICNTCSPLPHSQLLLPPVTSPDWLFSFRSLSPYYSYLFPTLYKGGEAFNPVIQVLVSTAPFSSTARVYLSHRCPSAASTATPPHPTLPHPCLWRISQPSNEPKWPILDH